MPRTVKLHKAELITFSRFRRIGVLELDLSCVYIAELDSLLLFSVDTAQADWDLLVNLLQDLVLEFILNGPRCGYGPAVNLEHLRGRFGIAGVDFYLPVPRVEAFEGC
jgi:hypothetical protein